MKIISYISSSAMSIVLLSILFYAMLEKNKVFDTFLIGAKYGVKTVYKIFPTLIGLFVAIGALRSSGILELIINILKPINLFFNIPGEIMPLALLRPISGSSSIAIATDIMKKNGVDSNVGLIASTIMGSTETTLYTISIYTGSVGIKNTRFIIWVALTTDLVGIIASVFIWNFIAN